MIQSVRGTNDILPSDSGLWQHIERVFRECSAQFGFQEIRTPIFEHTELFARGIGENTDVVSKEMYTFSDLGNETLTLRPEATAGLIRSAIEHTLVEKNPVVRLWTCGPMFRQERPQKGRYRQFHQFDAELLGSAFPESDVEVISFMYRIIQTIGLTSFEFQINSLGNIQSRIRYREALIRHFEPFAGELSDDSRSRLHRNPLRILDSKHPQDANVIHSAPKLAEFLDDESRAYFDEVQRLLHLCSIPFRVNDRLVRGLDYYCHTTFECVTGKLGSQNALGGGGRYDGLFEMLGGKPTPGVGFAFGIERLLLLLLLQQEEQQSQTNPNICDIYCIGLDEQSREQVLRLTYTLRTAGFRAMYDVLRRSFKAQMRDADRTGCRYVLIIGESERENNQVIVKYMQDGSQQLVANNLETIVPLLQQA